MRLVEGKVEAMRLIEIKADRILHQIFAAFNANQRHISMVFQVRVVENYLHDALNNQFTLNREMFCSVFYLKLQMILKVSM